MEEKLKLKRFRKIGIFVIAIVAVIIAISGLKIEGKDAKVVQTAGEDTITVKLEIRCSQLTENLDKLETPGIEKYIPKDGIILANTLYYGKPGETVFDALNALTRDNNIQLEFSYTPVYESYYIEGINYLYEYDCGPQSGWMYSVNGVFPNYGCSSYELHDGDQIVWEYTLEGYGEDLDANSWMDEQDESVENETEYGQVNKLSCNAESFLIDTAYAAEADASSIYKSCGDNIYKNVNPEFGNEWFIYGLKLAGKLTNDDIQNYKKSLDETVKSKKGVLHKKAYAEYSRVVFTLGKLNLDASDVGGYNLLEPLADFRQVCWQGINGPIWALKALDAGEYSIPTVKGYEKVSDLNQYNKTDENKKVLTTRKLLVEYIISQQLKDGGWAFSGSKADPDMTAMAIQSLAPYKVEKKAGSKVLSESVRLSIDKAVDCLSNMQNDDGTFSSYGAPNCESCAQVIIALCVNGINPDTNSKFTKKGKTLVDTLIEFYDSKECGFRHVNKPVKGYKAEVNNLATEQAYYALGEFFNCVPKKAAVTGTKKVGSGTVRVSWREVDHAEGYQLTYAKNSSFSKEKKSITVSSSTVRTKDISGLTKGKTYYFKVRAFNKINGKKLYGAYSKTIKVRL